LEEIFQIWTDLNTI